MDTTALVREAAARLKFQEAKQHLNQKYSNKLSITNQGGLWKITPAFLGFLMSYPNTVAYITDEYGNVLEVNVPELLIEAHKTYETVMKEWHANIAELKKSR